MVEQKHYDVVLTALALACEMINKSNIEITKDNMEMLEHKMYGSLKGYFLMKAEELLDKNNNQ
jgi:hypothetical protein